MTQLYALVLMTCLNSIECKEVVLEIYDTQAECSQVIYNERIFNAACYPVEKIVHQNESDIASN